VDVYSIGVALVAVMTGKYPFGTKKPPKAVAKKKIRSEWNADAKARMAKLDADTVELMRALLSVDPSKRPSAAEALQFAFFKNGLDSDDSKALPMVGRATLSAMSTASSAEWPKSDEELYNLFAKETGMSAWAPYAPLCPVCFERVLCASRPCAFCTALSTADVVSALGDLQTDVCVSAALLTLRRAAQAEWASSSSSVALTHYVMSRRSARVAK
jgi:serine/threonine protein kinase